MSSSGKLIAESFLKNAQEFVPSGRQQALKHPGRGQFVPKKSFGETEDLLLDKLEKVSLKERKEPEWWLLRKAPIGQFKENWSNRSKNGDKDCFHSNFNKSFYRQDVHDKSCSFKSFEHSHKTDKRASDNISRFSTKQENVCSSCGKNEFFQELVVE